MTTTDRKQQIIDQALDTRGAELRLQAIRADAALTTMTLDEMLEWVGGQLAAWQGPAGFRSAMDEHNRWWEARKR